MPIDQGNVADGWGPRPCGWPVVAICVLAGPVLHAGLLVAPLAAVGLVRRALDDPAVWIFLVMASGFYLADLPTLAYTPASAPGRGRDDDRRGRREAALASWLLLVTFWTALLERAAAGGPASGWSGALGGLLMLAGVVVRMAAVLALGRGFITEPRGIEGGALVERGVYAWVRHPSESGNLAVALGASVLLESQAGLLWVATGVVPLTLWRVRREERYLADAHGPRFWSYARRVKRLVPGVC